ncbi:double-strand break repair protein AddB [Methylocella sp.]|uniref:double-strand break repair protein AddB n=1 Tax=Methylocella sp. TaxID=1978226 RepID=UPI0037834827
MAKNVFSIAPGAPFLKTFARSFLEGRVVAGFSAALGPLALADATIYTPTRRAARALADEFSRLQPGRATLLPRILPLAALEETETELMFEAGAPFDEGEGADIFAPPPAVGALDRRMRLAELILAWARALRGAIVKIGADGAKICDDSEPPLVATSAVDAFALSGDLARLIDELAIEDVEWRSLNPLAAGFDDYWRITLDFLNIAIERWPQILAERGLADRASRQLALIEAQARRLGGEGGAPVVAIGVNGTSRAAARLLDAVARAPRGAVVLPGLDFDLDEPAFAQVLRAREGHEAAFTHPQAALARLLEALKISRADVVELGAPERALKARARFVSQALAPAETTEGWFAWREAEGAGALEAALEGVSLIETADEREEALALAIAMREVLERPEATAALVTPDRELARRVGAELARWGVNVDDSGGAPLGASEAGLLARHAAACAAAAMSAPSVAALLAHRRVSLGLGEEEARRRVPLLEIGVLRSPGGALLRDPEAALRAAAGAAGDRHAHPAQARLFPQEQAALQDLLERLAAALAPMLALDGEHDLSVWADAHEATLDALRAPQEALADDEAALAALFDELRLSARPAMAFDAESYLRFFASIAGEARFAGDGRVHPRVKILGLIEARLMDADLILLGGLDEAVWPPQAQMDCFLNRPMRAALGLTPPERRLGQAAHDFTQAMGRATVVLSRARKRGGAPTVASRFVQRLAALAGPQWEECARRGQRFVDYARLVDRAGDEPAPPRRPQPRPPVELRPTSLSVTRVETLRRDPYAVYAEKILRLLPLPGLDEDFGPAETGGAIHAAVERFSRTVGAGPTPPDARALFRRFLEEELHAQIEDADFAAFALPRLDRMIDFYVSFEARRRSGTAPLARLEIEASASHELTLADASTFRLTARADRIERRADGSVAVIDFKAGSVPGRSEVEVGFAPQLTLEAAMARRGAFGFSCDGDVEGLYVKLGGAQGGKELALTFKSKTFGDLAEDHYEHLLGLLAQFRDPQTPYPPRPFPKFAAAHNPYDHLARVREWAAGGEEEG